MHTPHSVLNNGFGSDFDAYAKTLFEQAIERGIAVIGITDYFTVKGFRQLRELQGDEDHLERLLGAQMVEPARQILLLPNIELRLSDVIKAGDPEPRVNLHVIFAEDISATEIERDFLHHLRFLSESAPDALDERRPLTEENLEVLGKQLKGDHPALQGSDLRVGMGQAVVTHEEVTDVLSRTRIFKKRHLLVLAADDPLSKINWDGQGHLTRKTPIQKAHMLFSANPKTRSFGLGETHVSPEAFQREFKSLKPCIHGSDAHKTDDLFVFANDRQLWVRADPTFNGLCQLLLAPAERVYVGSEPTALSRIRASATKLIDAVGFERVGQPGSDAEWFSGTVPLSPGLVAVIGKKGSGKSAFAEAIALAGNASNGAHFSFLNKKRFLNPRDRLGEHFRITLAWRSGDSEDKLLNEATDESLPERVKYIPQHYLEEVCTQVTDSSARTLFDEELEAVIFSHVSTADRVGQESLRGLVEHTTAEIEARIKQLRSRLAEANRNYFELHRRGSNESRKALLAQLAARKAELEAHEKAKPPEMPKPSADAEANPEATAAASELATIVERIEEFDRQISDLEKREEQAKKRRTAIERILGRIDNLRTAVATFYDESTADFELLGFDARQLVHLQVDDEEIEKSRVSTATEIEELEDLLDPDHTGSPIRVRAEASARADQLRHRLGEPERRYQEYQRALAQWQRTGAEIGGAADKPESIAGLEAKLAALDELPGEIAATAQMRDQLTAQIFAAKEELLTEYRRLYKPVQDFIEKHPVAQKVTALSFSAENALDGLVDGFLGMIHHGRRGSFQGDQEGREYLQELMARHDLTTAAGVAEFLAKLTEALTHDIRQEERPEVEIGSQLVASARPEILYDFLFGLEYLRPRFELRWGNKPMHQLSPGERGTLLLIFYLLIDTDGAPLLIDQPEENLDNETVTQLLVPAVRHAKERRQIIMVTHNPNLAVVCDADQVIHASIDKAAGNRISYTAGSIEDPNINQLIVDVLEGTKPAFDLRDAKYDVLDRVAA